MSRFEFIIFVLILAFATALTRFLPFLFFKNSDKTPLIVDYLAKVLPASMMGLLVVYCFKDINFTKMNELLPMLVSCICVVLIHLKKKNTILSIALGTFVYMILLRII